MKLFNHFLVEMASATHKRHDTGQFIRLLPGRPTNQYWHDLCDNVAKRVEIPLFSEKISLGDNIPICVAITLLYPTAIKDGAPYDDKFLDKAVEITNDCVKSVAGIMDGDDALTVAIMQTAAYPKGKDTAYTIRIQYPLARMAVADQKKHLRPKLIKAYKKTDILDLLLVRTRLSWETLLDGEYIGSEGIPIYGTGSHKEYEVRWYNPSGDLVSLESLTDILPVNKHKDSRTGLTSDETLGPAYWLSLLLSIGYEAGEIYVPASIVQPDTQVHAEKEGTATDQQKYAEELLPMIFLHRYKEESYRTRIGKALYNIFEGKERGFQLWVDQIKLSLGENEGKKSKSQSGLLDEESLRIEYAGFSNNNPLTDITLENYAAEDKPQQHEEWITKKCGDLMVQSLMPDYIERLGDDGRGRGGRQNKKSITQGAVARVFYMKNRRFITYLKGKWYKFNGTYLEHIEDGPAAEVNDFRKDYEQYQMILVERRNSADGGERNHLNNLLTEITSVITSLDTESYYNGVVRCLRTIIARNTRDARPDYDPRVFADAGKWVLESRDKDDEGNSLDMLIRRGNIEDFCTKHSFVTYNDQLNLDSKWVKKSRKMDLTTFGGDSQVVDYFDEIYSKAMRRNNGEKKGINWVGRPGTAKTTKREELDTAYGTYSFGPSSTILTGDRPRSSNPTPESAMANDCCSIVVEEPEYGKVNESWYVEQTGGSKSHKRLLQDNGGMSRASAQVTIISNDSIALTPKEQNKIRHVIIRFVAIYVPEEGQPEIGLTLPATKEEQKRLHIYKKKTITQKMMNNLAIARLWRWVQRHSQIDFDDAVKIPRSVRQETDKYWNRYDYFTVFRNTNLVRVGKNQNPFQLTVDIAHKIFGYWFSPRYRGMPVPDRNNFMICMRPVIGDPNDDEIYELYTLKSQDYDDFVKDRLDQPGGDVELTVRDVRREFNDYMSRNNPNIKLPDYRMFMIYIVSRLGPECYDTNKKVFSGWTNVKEVKEAEEDD